MRSILLHVADDVSLDARLQVALDLARSFGGHLTCLQATPYEVGVPGDLYGSMAVELLPQLRKAADALHAKVGERLGREDVAWDWLQEDGPAAYHLLRMSGLSDVIVMGAQDGFNAPGKPSALAGDVAIRARTPVLLVPQEASSFDCGGTGMVAWNGSPEAARALRAAVPLLARAQSVFLATAVTDSPDAEVDLPAVEGAEYLSRHGISCEMVEVPMEGRSAAEALSAAAQAREAAYMVMGAYGHARLLEQIWGGVTREILSRPKLPLLISH